MSYRDRVEVHQAIRHYGLVTFAPQTFRTYMAHSAAYMAVHADDIESGSHWYSQAVAAGIHFC